MTETDREEDTMTETLPDTVREVITEHERWTFASMSSSPHDDQFKHDLAAAIEGLIAARIGRVRGFPLDMAQVTCPDCRRDAYPDTLGEAIDWALSHQCGEENEA